LYIEPLGFTKTDFDDGMELSWPISAKDMLKLEGKTPVLMFGDPIDGPNNSDPLELTREEIVETYRFVREDVARSSRPSWPDSRPALRPAQEVYGIADPEEKQLGLF
jgi:hypothetical protein